MAEEIHEARIEEDGRLECAICGMDDIEILRGLCHSVYLTKVQQEALGRVLDSFSRRPQRAIPLSRTPLHDVPEDREILRSIHRATTEQRPAAEAEPSLLNEAEKEREQLLGKCGAE